MAHVTGNATWVDWPNTSTIMSAGALENIEGQLDRNPSDAGFFLRRMSAAQSIAAATNTTLTFGTSVFATVHTTATSTSVFTFNDDGVYLVEAGAVVSSSAATALTLWLLNVGDNNRYGSTGGASTAASGFPSAQLAVPVRVTAGTQFSAQVYSSAAATIAASTGTHFSATLLRRL